MVERSYRVGFRAETRDWNNMYSYLDESIDEGRSGIFVVGGLLMRGVPSFELERKWEKLRKRSCLFQSV
jgi:hypothetical protein